MSDDEEDVRQHTSKVCGFKNYQAYLEYYYRTVRCPDCSNSINQTKLSYHRKKLCPNRPEIPLKRKRGPKSSLNPHPQHNLLIMECTLSVSDLREYNSKYMRKFKDIVPPKQKSKTSRYLKTKKNTTNNANSVSDRTENNTSNDGDNTINNDGGNNNNNSIATITVIAQPENINHADYFLNNVDDANNNITNPVISVSVHTEVVDSNAGKKRFDKLMSIIILLTLSSQ